MRRETLAEIGGFAAVVDTLADDYAIGAAVRARGHAIAIPPFVVAHTSGPMRLRELWRHELRWARTIRAIALWGHAGSLITHPLPWSVLALGLGAPSGLVWPALVLMIAAGVGRIALLHRVARSFGFTPQSYWLVPARDLFSFTVFVASFFGRSVSWRGGRFLVQADGTLLSQEDSRTP
jgi:ceramide glucosyltransferase